MQVIFVGEYELPDNLEQRASVYGTTDPAECARLDAGMNPHDLFTLCDRVAIVSVIPEPQKQEAETP